MDVGRSFRSNRSPDKDEQEISQEMLGPVANFVMDSREGQGRRRRRNRGCESTIVGSLPRARRIFSGNSPNHILVLMMVLLVLIIMPVANAAFVTFDNCLAPAIRDSQNPQQLQFVPYFVDAKFNTSDPKHNLNITVYGNVTGQATTGNYPPPDSPDWGNNSVTFGKIINATANYTTLFSTVRVLSYTPYNAAPAQFCEATTNGTCPWGPLFTANTSDPYSLHAFSISHDFYSSYSFATFAANMRVQSGDRGGPPLACISVSITPDLGRKLSDAIRYIPAAILALVGIATVFAARFSPWSSQNVFYWTSNYGRDDDILRLVTPGFGDCLQYIQFVVLAGSLSLGYPGFYQPVVSQASWSVLMFNESFVSHGNGTQSLVDGIYRTNGTYGLTRLSQLAGMTRNKDVWAGMTIWVCVIIAAIVILCQLGFATQWFVRMLSDTPQEDLRSKNLPFTAGIITRILFNYFLLPIVTLSMFQMVVAYRSPAYVVAMAVLMTVAIICFAAWIFRLIFTTRPRVHLFDHLPLLLTYGPLYNTYSDEAAPYAFIPFLLTFIRGIAMGAVQPSGIAQLVILAICEVILILTLHAFRPFQSLTSMNAYHTFFAVIRLVTTLLSVAFVPSLGVSETSKGWIGYAILLLHAIVLVFGFFLNSIQTLIEVFIRQAGAGGDTRGGLTTVFGMRQLSKRVRRHEVRGSMTSEATALTESKSSHGGKRSRSISASSGMMLNATTSPDQRGSANFDSISQGEAGSMVSGTSPGPSTPGGHHSPFSFIPGANSFSQGRRVPPSLKAIEPTDPYYRPPRLRRPTLEALQDVSHSGEEPEIRVSAPVGQEYSDTSEGPSSLNFPPSRASPAAAFMRNFRDNDSESNLSEARRKHTDYSTRESDFYYGVRGPALSSMPSRRLKTGPADPMSPIGSATGWFKNFFNSKAKDQKKGFEVVRSTPLHLLQEQDEESPPLNQEPYRDSPERSNVTLDGAGGATSRGLRRESDDSHYPSDSQTRMRQLSDAPPMLGPMTMGSSILMPSRSASKSSSSHPGNIRNQKRSSSGDLPPPQHPNVLPRVSSFRGPGNRDPEARVPFTGSEKLDRSGRESAASSIYPASEDAADVVEAGGEAIYSHPYDGHFQQRPGPAFTQERPVSIGTGRVKHHVASESIHHGIYGGEVHQGSAAELVDMDHRKSRDWAQAQPGK